MDYNSQIYYYYGCTDKIVSNLNFKVKVIGHEVTNSKDNDTTQFVSKGYFTAKVNNEIYSFPFKISFGIDIYGKNKSIPVSQIDFNKF